MQSNCLFELFNPKRRNAVDPELFIAAQEDPDLIAGHVHLCEKLQSESQQTMFAEMEDAAQIFFGLSEEDLDEYIEENVSKDHLAKILTEEIGFRNGERNAAAYVAMHHLIHSMDLGTIGANRS